MKTCPKCLVDRPAAAFYGDRSKADGLSSYCRACSKARSVRRWKERNAECRAANKAYYGRNKEQFLEYGRALRVRVLTEYGGACVCCGERTPEFLSIDHTNNDGESHRRELGAYGRSIYRWLEQNGYPKDRFQLLCHNCNMAKGLYGGCPHAGPVPGRRQAATRWTAARTPSIGDVARPN